jgi:hypothetical protein
MKGEENRPDEKLESDEAVGGGEGGDGEESVSLQLASVGSTTHQAHPTRTTNPNTTHPPAFAAQSPDPAVPPAAEPPSKPFVFHSGAHSSMEESSASISNA